MGEKRVRNVEEKLEKAKTTNEVNDAYPIEIQINKCLQGHMKCTHFLR